MGVRRNGRILAFQGIYAWEDNKSDFDELVKFDWLDHEIEADIRNFAVLLIAGTLEQLDAIDSQIRSNLESWSFDRLSKVDLALLRTSVYALMFQSDIPYSVTINEAIEIAKKFGSPESYRFINGVLDGIRKATLS